MTLAELNRMLEIARYQCDTVDKSCSGKHRDWDPLEKEYFFLYNKSIATLMDIVRKHNGRERALSATAQSP